MREFLLGLEENSCGDGDMEMCTALENLEYLVINLFASGLGYWLLIINLGQ